MDAGSSDPKLAMVDEGMVAPDGLWLTRRAFGATLTPKGNCIAINQGYIFVTRFQGGMGNRWVWLSRKKFGGTEWKHIPLDHQHVMFRGDRDLPEDEQRGDAHNNIAIGICPRDGTIHLLYDMHAYRKPELPDSFFNYSYTRPGAATALDSEWSCELFHPKQTYLNKAVADEKKEGAAYERVTYPGFFNTADGSLIAHWRVGGTNAACMHLTKYEGGSWGPSVAWNCSRVNKTSDFAVGFYGEFRHFNDMLFACWHRRCDEDAKLGYVHNRGLYVAHCADAAGLGEWLTAAGDSMGFPLDDLERAKIAEPSTPGQNMNQCPAFVATKSGAWHALVSVDNTASHYFRASLSEELQVTSGHPIGDLHTAGDAVYLVSLEGGRPVILCTKEGKDDWREAFRLTKGRRYSHGVSVLAEGAIYFYLMEICPAAVDARPLHVLRFPL